MADQTEPRRRTRNQNARVLYESAGPAQLARQPAHVTVKAGAYTPEWGRLKQHLEQRLAQLTSWRFSWMQNWQLLEAYILPRRGAFINSTMPTPNTMVRGAPINQNIVDPTGTIAMRKCAAGMMSGLMSPSRPWFKLKPRRGTREDASSAIQQWFEDVEDRMYDVLSRSNFYESGSQMFEDLVTFGTGPMLIYEDVIDVIRCYVPCCGEYFLSSSSAMRVEAMCRLFVMTMSQIVEMFGVENCPSDIQKAWVEKGGQLEVERIVAHAIEPNFAVAFGSGEVGVVPGNFTWRETYWIWGSSKERPLSRRGFEDQPHIAPRWAVTSNDPYGRSVGMDVWPDIMQLQVMTKRLAEAEEKMVRPPLIADATLENRPSSVLPGRVTYVAGGVGPDKGMRPIYTVMPQIKEFGETIMQVQTRIKEGFFNDLFMMLETASNKNMTAYEVAQRQQEKLQVLGPVIERLQNEALAPAIKRVFAIMARKGLLPPPPPGLYEGGGLGIEYVSMLAIAQKAASSSALERFAATMGNMQAGDPAVADTWDRDEWTKEYASDIFLPKRILNSPAKIAVIRQQRAQQLQAQQAAQIGTAAVQGAQTLSQTPVGGGGSALDLMLGTHPQGNA